MQLLSNLFGSLRALYILFIIVFGVGGAYLSIAAKHENSNAQISSADADEWRDGRPRPRGTVAQQWERDRREAEEEEAIRAAYGY